MSAEMAIGARGGAARADAGRRLRDGRGAARRHRAGGRRARALADERSVPRASTSGRSASGRRALHGQAALADRAARARAGRGHRLGRLPRQQPRRGQRRRRDDAPGSTTTARTSDRRPPPTTASTAGAALSGLTATSYDPAGDGGDGDEHPADTANALDGDPSTIWRTDTYRGSPEFNGAKPGVGPDPDLARGRSRPRRCTWRRASAAGRAASTRRPGRRRPRASPAGRP